MSDTPQRILIIAGPNGAGKTTFAEEFLPKEAGCPRFVNADMIAAGLSPFQPEKQAIKAGRLMIHQMEEYIEKKVSFSFETTLSAKRYARLIPQWQNSGYMVKIFFLRLNSPELAIARVSQRVREGGHFVADDTVKRRFYQGWYNFQKVYRNIVNEWSVYDNSSGELILLEEGGMK
jgi:predicted ABC-type ATPase